MISLPFRVACILIAGFFIVLIVTYTYKFNNRKVFWGVGLTTVVSILILLGLGILRPSWGTETGMAVIVGICTAIGCAITLIYAAEDLHQKKQTKGKNIAATGNEPLQIFAKAIEAGYMEEVGSHYEWILNKVLLAYMCGRIYCEDYPEKTKYDDKVFWMPGRVELFPGTELDKLFNMKDLTQSRHSRKNKAAPVGSEKIDKLFE